MINSNACCTSLNYNLSLSRCATDHFNWCTVPGKAYDATLFAGFAVLCACLLQGKFSALWVLLAGKAATVYMLRAAVQGALPNTLAC